jgi:hypothetical protein
MFSTLASHQWLVAADKLRLGYTHVALLGWLVGGGEKRADPKKLEGIEKLQRPQTVTQVKSFLGAVGWYRYLVKDFGKLAKPLTVLLKADQPFVWEEAQEQAWLTLKAKLLEDPVLKLPRRSGRYTLYTDWSS